MDDVGASSSSNPPTTGRETFNSVAPSPKVQPDLHGWGIYSLSRQLGLVSHNSR